MRIRKFSAVLMSITFLGTQIGITPHSFAKGVDPEEKVEYYLYDHLGGVDVVLDEQGNVVERKDYLPYGEERIAEGSANERHGFTGKELDDESGLYYYGARYYDPSLGRFISQDPMALNEAERPLGSFLNDPQALNGYTYARNNPIAYNDPTGQFAILALIPSAAQLIEAAMAGIMAYVVVRDLQAPVIEVFPSFLENKKNNVETYPAFTQEEPNTTTYPEFSAKRQNVVINPGYSENDTGTVSFPNFENPIAGCGINMSCANDDGANIRLPADPEKEGYTWKGNGKKGVDRGTWVNEKTGEKIYPDRGHNPPIGPHDDYTDRNGKEWRVSPDGKSTPKKSK